MLMAFTHQLIIIYYEGVTTVLTMTFLGLEARTDLPQVAYPTALDYFVFISFMFIFSTVVQVKSFFFPIFGIVAKFSCCTNEMSRTELTPKTYDLLLWQTLNFVALLSYFLKKK